MKQAVFLPRAHNDRYYNANEPCKTISLKAGALEFGTQSRRMFSTMYININIETVSKSVILSLLTRGTTGSATGNTKGCFFACSTTILSDSTTGDFTLPRGITY